MPVTVPPNPPSTLQTNCAWVVIDCVLLATGAIALRPSIQTETAEEVAQAAVIMFAHMVPALEALGNAGTSPAVRAQSVFLILKGAYASGSLGGIVKALEGALGRDEAWLQEVLFGAAGVAAIVAAVATDGTAFAAQTALFIPTFDYLANDANAALKSANGADVAEAGVAQTAAFPSPPGPQNPYPFMPRIGIQTSGGWFLAAVDGGGSDASDSAIITSSTTIGPSELFKVVPLDEGTATFAMQTANGTYVTAVDGGTPGPAGPIISGTWLQGPFGAFTLVQQVDGSFAICTAAPAGYFLTAQNGGGMPANGYCLATDATSIGPNETFTMVPFV